MILKRILTLALALTMVISVAACGSGGSGDSSDGGNVEERTRVGICVNDLGDGFIIAYRSALQEELEAKGYEVSVADGKNDQAVQTEQIGTLIAQEVDALIINPVTASAADAIIAQVKAAGIPTVLVNCAPSAEGLGLWDRIACVGCDAAQAGAMLGELILDTPNQGDINGNGRVTCIVLTGGSEDLDAQMRAECAVERLTEAGITVEQLNLTGTDGIQDQSREACTNALTQYGPDIEVIFCGSGVTAASAEQAITDAGYLVGEDLCLVGFDALDLVIAGNATGTVLNDALGEAARSAEVMELLLNGAAAEKRYDVDCITVTPDNAEDYAG